VLNNIVHILIKFSLETIKNWYQIIFTDQEVKVSNLLKIIGMQRKHISNIVNKHLRIDKLCDKLIQI
jgi:hypothetical protein